MIRRYKVVCYKCDGKQGGCEWCGFAKYMVISTTKDKPFGAIEELK